MTADLYLDIAMTVTLLALGAAVILVCVRILRGPTLPDRIMALDLLVATVIGLIAAWGIETGHALYVDVAIVLGLVGLLSTIALSRLVLRRGDSAIEADEPRGAGHE
jgi:multicomponent Na+:H+ antiporter subunit F